MNADEGMMVANWDAAEEIWRERETEAPVKVFIMIWIGSIILPY